MIIQLPDKVSKILDILMDHGYEAYAVGGCIRDTMLGRVPGDWDITTSAKPEEVKALFRKTIDTGIQHGTVTVMMEREGFEVTTYRIDGEYEDARHPKEVTFTSNLIEDLKRRDFTINAMAYNHRDGLVDEFDGAGDLKRRIIRCVGNAKERFTEDALRMMRGVRFSAQLDFAIEKETEDAIRELAPNIAKVSAERIQVELVKLLLSDHPERMRDLYATGITDVILPEFSKMMVTEQDNPHHCYTVGEHTIHALMGVEADKVLRLTMLLHDVAKPVCISVGEDGINHFYGHPAKGAKMSEQMLKRLKFDNDTIDKVRELVKWHDDNPPLKERAIRRAMVRVGLKQYPALFAVKRADILAQSLYQRKEKLEYVEGYERMYQQRLEQNECLDLKQLAVNGGDLIKAGMKPGKEMGVMLQQLFELVLENPEYKTREYLLKEIEKLLQ